MRRPDRQRANNPLWRNTMKMKLAIGLMAGTLTLGSVAALAQMNHGEMQKAPMPANATQPGLHGGMNHEMHRAMRERMMQHHAQMQHGPGMQHGPMHGGGQAGAHPGGHGSAKPKGDTGPASAAFQAINQKMHEGMDITFTGNTDVDFVRGMIPHHQGAVDMAKTLIAFGKDPQIRKLAEEIVKSQESEIAMMQEWLKKNAN
jgi:uncharacterized protein (DUF305 family)